MSNPRSLALALSLLLIGAVGCSSEEAARGPLVAPEFLSGKADVGDRVALRGALALGAGVATTGAFVADLQFDGYTLAVRPGAVVSLELTHAGTASRLDTTLYLYGPAQPTGGYGETARAFDDDAGWGKLSRLGQQHLAEGGDYLVVVGTHDGLGRGSYRLTANCASPDGCAPLPAAAGCHPAILEAMRACVQDQLASPDYDSSTTSRIDLLQQCSDAEPMAPVHDALCASASPPAELGCGGPYEAFAVGYLPTCYRTLYDETLDQTCVFGDRYGALFEQQGAVVVLWSRALDGDEPLSELERQQIVAAVHATAYDDVTTVEEAFAAVDDGIVQQHELWDASNRRGYTVYGVWAGDNSFGMYFATGTTTAVARNNDGDVYDCTVTWGSELRLCGSDDDCAAGLRCTGRGAEGRQGRCIDPAADQHPAQGQECTGEQGCPAGSGLVCAGAVSRGVGVCNPAWQRGRFVSAPQLAIPDGAAAGTEAQLAVFGLATVDVDVVLDLYINHPRIRDLKVSLVDPAGTEVVVFDHAADGGELVLRATPVLGFPGDESVNGSWRLKVVDDRASGSGTIEEFGLTITSRWD